MYETHPMWIATKEMLSQAYIDLADALQRLDTDRVEEERLNVIGLRESATSLFSNVAVDLDFSALCAALIAITQSEPAPDC